MDYNRPDNINDTLSATLIERRGGEMRNTSPWSFILLLVLLLVLALALYYFLIYKKQNNVEVPIYKNGALSTSTLSTNTVQIYINNNSSTTAILATSTTIVLPNIEKLFYTIWPDAISGYSFNKNGSIIFQDKATGHIYKADKYNYEPYKIANTSINNLHLSFFANDGSTIIFQTLNQNTNTLSTYIADIATYNGQPANLYNSAYLGDKIYDISISPDSKYAAYILEDTKKYNSNVYNLDIKSREIKLIYSYKLPHMRLQYYSTNSLSIYQNPSENKVSQSYILNIKNSNLTPILKEEQLISNINDMGYLYSNRLGLFLQNKKLTSKISFYTTANKCVWSHTATYVLCGVNENYNADNLNEYLDQSKIYADNLYIHGIDYVDEKIIYDFINYNNIPVHINSMSISVDNENLAIMDQVRGLYLLKIYNILSAEAQ